MEQRTLLPDAGEVVLDRLQVSGRNWVVMVLRPSMEGSRCPACERTSRRRHSWYKRRLGDLPWERIPVGIELHVRGFFCDNDRCGQHIFAERLSETAPRYARRTARLSVALEQITQALGGSAESRLAQRLGILTSDSTLLRQLRAGQVGIAPGRRVYRVSTTGHDAKGSAMERSFATWNAAR